MVKLLSYNQILLGMVNKEDGIFLRAFKLAFSSEISNMFLYLLFAIVLIVWLGFNAYKNIKIIISEYDYSNSNKMIGYMYTAFTLIDIVGVFVLFGSILAPILVSFVVIIAIAFVVIYAYDN